MRRVYIPLSSPFLRVLCRLTKTKTFSKSISSPLPTAVWKTCFATDCTPFARLQQDKGLSAWLSDSRLVIKSGWEAPSHQPEIFDLTTSSLGEDGKSPQYEAPHGRVASSNCLDLNEAWRTRPREYSRDSGRGSRMLAPRIVSELKNTLTCYHSHLTMSLVNWNATENI